MHIRNSCHLTLLLTAVVIIVLIELNDARKVGRNEQHNQGINTGSRSKVNTFDRGRRWMNTKPFLKRMSMATQEIQNHLTTWWNKKRSRARYSHQRKLRKKRDAPADPWQYSNGDDYDNYYDDVLYVEGGDYEVKTAYVSTPKKVERTTPMSKSTSTVSDKTMRPKLVTNKSKSTPPVVPVSSIDKLLPERKSTISSTTEKVASSSTASTAEEKKTTTKAATATPETTTEEEKETTKATTAVPETTAEEEKETTKATAARTASTTEEEKAATKATTAASETATEKEKQTTKATTAMPETATEKEKETTKTSTAASETTTEEEKETTKAKVTSTVSTTEEEKEATKATTAASETTTEKEKETTKATAASNASTTEEEKETTKVITAAPETATEKEKATTKAATSASETTTEEEKEKRKATTASTASTTEEEKETTKEAIVPIDVTTEVSLVTTKSTPVAAHVIAQSTTTAASEMTTSVASEEKSTRKRSQHEETTKVTTPSTASTMKEKKETTKVTTASIASSTEEETETTKATTASTFPITEEKKKIVKVTTASIASSTEVQKETTRAATVSTASTTEEEKKISKTPVVKVSDATTVKVQEKSTTVTEPPKEESTLSSTKKITTDVGVTSDATKAGKTIRTEPPKSGKRETTTVKRSVSTTVDKVSTEKTTTEVSTPTKTKIHKIDEMSSKARTLATTTTKKGPVSTTTKEISTVTQTSTSSVSTPEAVILTSTITSSTQSSTTPKPTPTPTTTPAKPRWISDPNPYKFCNDDCKPNLAVTTHVCAVGFGTNLQIVSNSLCDQDDIPCSRKSFNCTRQPCGSWKMTKVVSKCNVTCGNGFRKEEYNCQLNGSTVPYAHCLRTAKPSLFQKCFGGPCGNVTWLFSRWSKCIGFTCYGMQYRKALCHDSAGNVIPYEYCLKYLPIPKLRITCTKPKCENEYFWYKGEWSDCSAECGAGVQLRHVACLRRLGANKVVVGNRCNYRYKPSTERPCEVKKDICPKWMSSIVWHTPPGRKRHENCTSTRRVICVNGTRIISPTLCPPSKRPISKRPCVPITRSTQKYSYEDADANIRLSDGEVIKTDLYWTCPPRTKSAHYQKYVWVKLQGQEEYTVYREHIKRHFEVKVFENGRRVIKFPFGLTIPFEYMGHYLCIGYNDTQNMWNGDYIHRTIGYYDTKLVLMMEKIKAHEAKAGTLVRFVCRINADNEDDIVWLRNEVPIKNVFGTEHVEFMKTTGKMKIACKHKKTGVTYKVTVGVEPMKESQCASQPYGCCSQGFIPGVTQLHKECGARNVIPCKRSRFGCCPKQNVPAIGKQHLGCKYRYIHPSRCQRDSQTLLNAMNRCFNDGFEKGIGQLRFHLDVTLKICKPIVVNVDCPHLRDIPLFATVENCRSHCINVNRTERCKIHPVSIPNDGKCRVYEHTWSYNIWQKECKPIKPGSCLMNANRFTSQTACNRECKYPRYTRQAQDECFLPKAEGTCGDLYGYEYFFFFDYSVGQCKRFQFYGCHGTSNRFLSLESCNKTCHGKVTPKVIKKICSLPRDLGYCPLSPVHVRRWYHDPKDGICKEMLYTQCGGNANNFETQRQCTQACGANITVDICELNHDKGDCLDKRSARRYYFDKNLRRCRPFNYTGCGGNPNNFKSLRDCNQACFDRTTAAPTPPPITPREPKTIQRLLDYEPCRMPQSSGNCPSSKSKTNSQGQMSRWYFDVRDRRCRSFMYTGCRGNANLFDSRNLCELKCEDRLNKVSRKCKRKVRRRCLADIGGESVYVYDHAMGQCIYKRLKDRCKRLSVLYFRTMEDCQSTCSPPPATDEHVTDKCYVTPQTFEQCPEYQRVRRWYYSVQERTCVQYTTCPYTRYLGNSHSSQVDCQRQCMSSYLGEICSLPMDTGKCSTNRTYEMFYFNYKSKSCEKLWYTGCLGNKNRFGSLVECRAVCEPEMKDTTVIEGAFRPNTSLVKNKPEYEHYRKIKMNICNINFTKAHYGTCSDGAYLEKWYFAEGKCSRFYYRGCGAPLNFFDTRFACEDECMEKSPKQLSNALAVQTSCQAPPFSGKCRRKTKRWYSDPLSGKCKPFKGCAGIPNSFSSEEACQKTCYSTEFLNVCRLPKEPGPCSMPMMRWHYDNSVRQCRKFIYMGCHGNGNRFMSQLECENSCHRADPCRLPQDPGDIESDDWYRRFFFNATSRKCEHMWFSGKGGNANRFETEKECKRKCEVTAVSKSTPATTDQTFTCLQPIEDDISCTGASKVERTFAHYNAIFKTCIERKYNVCDDVSIIGNRFRSVAACEELCKSQEVIVEDKRRCNASVPKLGFCKDWQEQWYFDKKEMECKAFWFGQCEETEITNRFPSKESCELTCIQISTPATKVTINVHVEDTKSKKSEARGTCPNLPDSLLDIEPCNEECENDSNCEGGTICCTIISKSPYSKCPRYSACKAPLLPSLPNQPPCALSKFGCCPDNIKEAKDKYLMSCDHCAPFPESSAFEKLNTIDGSSFLSIKCDIKGAPKPEIDWYHDDKKIDFGHGVQVFRITKKDFEILISPVRAQDGGKWSCKATNQYGSATKNFEVHVDIPAYLVKTSPKVVKVNKGESVILSCLAKGLPFPSVNWYFKKKRDENYTIIAQGPSTYNIQQVNVATTGFYKCVADNGIHLPNGHIYDTETMRVVANVPLKAYIISYPYDKKVIEGNPMRLQCKAVSAPKDARIYWYRNGRIMNSKMIADQDYTELRVDDTTLADAGDYWCHIEDSHGERKSFPVHFEVYRDSSLLPSFCKDEEMDPGECKFKIESLSHSRKKSCKGTHLEEYCCKKCYEMGRLELSDIIDISRPPLDKQLE